MDTGDGVAKGNYGVGDLKLAFQWTVDNIHKFGGNREKIIISGQSAGGAMASILMLDQSIRSRGKDHSTINKKTETLTKYVEKLKLTIGKNK